MIVVLFLAAVWVLTHLPGAYPWGDAYRAVRAVTTIRSYGQFHVWFDTITPYALSLRCWPLWLHLGTVLAVAAAHLQQAGAGRVPRADHGSDWRVEHLALDPVPQQLRRN